MTRAFVNVFMCLSLSETLLSPFETDNNLKKKKKSEFENHCVQDILKYILYVTAVRCFTSHWVCVMQLKYNHGVKFTIF